MTSHFDSHAPAEVALEFVRAFSARDLDAFSAVLDPEVELHSMRGLRKGTRAAREWATRARGGVQQSIHTDELRIREGPKSKTLVVALITRQWHWEEDGSFAGEERVAWVFELGDGLVLSWRPYDRQEDALRAAGFDTDPSPPQSRAEVTSNRERTAADKPTGPQATT